MPRFRLRDGNANDIERITDITLSAMKEAKDNLFAYNFPHSDEYPEDNRYYWKLRLEPAAYKKNAKLIVVEAVGSQGESKVVAWSDWDFGTLRRRSLPRNLSQGTLWGRPLLVSQYCTFKDQLISSYLGMYISTRTSIMKYLYPRRDADPAHYQAFFTAADEADGKYWKGLYPENLYLSGFYTAPEYQGQGAGHMMMLWGFQAAAAKHAVIGLSASNKRAAEIYRHWGFDDIGTITIQNDGEEAHVEMPVLLYKPNIGE